MFVRRTVLYCTVLEELYDCILSGKNAKAADLDGMTMEVLKAAVRCGASSMLECIRYILDNCHKGMPEQMCLNKLIPLPKSAASGEDLNMHRGVAVSNLFSKLQEKYMNRRFTDVCEARKLRSITPCGFRRGHGTLDAMFTLRHMVDKVRHMPGKGNVMYACAVDYKEAFDTVKRDLVIKRCKEIGVTGKFLEAMESMYANISMVVSLQGKQGVPFRTYEGTKQGSELSPLLFGLFIEQLHYLIETKVPGAGPVIDGMNIPIILYADDAFLMAVNSYEQMQELLKVLELFGFIFDMEVNFD